MLELWALIAVLFGGFGGWIAVQKGRSVVEGFALGGLFGPLGVLVEALLPQGTERSGGSGGGRPGGRYGRPPNRSESP